MEAEGFKIAAGMRKDEIVRLSFRCATCSENAEADIAEEVIEGEAGTQPPAADEANGPRGARAPKKRRARRNVQ